MGVRTRLAHAWNAFNDRGQVPGPFPTTGQNFLDYGAAYASRPDRPRLGITNERSIISSIYTRLSIDVASVDIRHIRLDEQNRYVEDVKSGLHDCLTVEANLDQAAREFRQDIVMTLCDKGVCAIVPVDTSLNPNDSGGYDIKTLRVGEIVNWMPRHVRVSLYNENTGRREEIVVDKRTVAIITNPLYHVMNEPNSTLQRLVTKLQMLDSVDNVTSSGKLDLIIQLPYVIKSEARRQQAEQRGKDLEMQLKDSQYGIAYTDGTEKIVQLNRPVENKLMEQVEYLVNLLYSQLGLTAEVMNGTADEAAMLNYNNRTVEPILGAISEAMARSFLTKTARSQGQSIGYFRDPFKLVPMAELAELADKFTRNEIVSSNEFRGFIGMRPSKDPKADELRNSNMPDELRGAAPVAPDAEAEPEEPDPSTIVNDAFDQVDSTVDEIFTGLGVAP
jgi:hypothetical protein